MLNKSLNFKFYILLFLLTISVLSYGCLRKSTLEDDRVDMGNPYVALVIEPKDSKVVINSYKQFAVNAIDTLGNYTKVNPSWSTTYGRITDKGEYIAPDKPGEGIIKAKFANLVVSTQIFVISDNEIRDFCIIPESGEIEVGRSTQLIFQAKNAAGELLHVLPSWSVDYGNITNTGFFSAPGSPCLAKITARVGHLETHAYFKVISTIPNFIIISPDSATVLPNSTQKFSATVYDRYGNIISSKGLVWSTNYGYISQDGEYTCPNVAAPAMVIAKIGNVYKIAYVNTSSGATATRLEITPPNAVLSLGESRQFTVKAYDINNVEVGLPGIPEWTTTNGTINSEGLFTAFPANLGLSYIKVTCGHLSAEVVVLITN